MLVKKVAHSKSNLAIRSVHVRRLRSDSFCLRLSTVSLSRERHDILDFSSCPLSRVLHVTLANLQRFGSDQEIHLKSSPSAFGG